MAVHSIPAPACNLDLDAFISSQVETMFEALGSDVQDIKEAIHKIAVAAITAGIYDSGILYPIVTAACHKTEPGFCLGSEYEAVARLMVESYQLEARADNLMMEILDREAEDVARHVDVLLRP